MKKTHNNRDCSTCPHRVELHPEYKNAEWDDLPCSRCDSRGYEKTLDRERKYKQMITLDPQYIDRHFASDAKEPWEYIDAPDASTVERDMKLADAARKRAAIVKQAAEVDRRLPAILAMVELGYTQQQMAEAMNTTRQTIALLLNKIRTNR
jgi:hypothetical protein